MKDRILRIIREEQLTPARFADILGVQRSSISHYLSGRNNPGIDFVQKILLKFKYINADWLISGKGEMYKHTGSGQLPLNLPLETPNLFSATSPQALEIPLPQTVVPEISKPKEDIKAEIITKIVENKVLAEKIIIYYSDHTFQEFFPSTN